LVLSALASNVTGLAVAWGVLGVGMGFGLYEAAAHTQQTSRQHRRRGGTPPVPSHLTCAVLIFLPNWKRGII
jgi:hypothetical protein